MNLLLNPEKITAEAFAPYGQVVMHVGNERRCPVPLDLGADKSIPVCSWVNSIAQPITGGELEVQLERHPFSDQLFVPLDGQRYLAIVCDDADGLPNLETLKAFWVPAGRGVRYQRNVWHAGMKVFDAPCHFYVLMGRRNDGLDDEFLPQTTAIELTLPTELLPTPLNEEVEHGR